MNRRLGAIVAIAVVAAAAATLARPAGAASGKSATYFPMSDCHGLLVIDATPGATFFIRNEQQDGSYKTVTSGQLSAIGEAQALVPHSGPTNNGQPQYVVYLRTDDGECCQILGSGAGSLEEEWWLD